MAAAGPDGLSPGLLKAAVLVSGIYELEPVLGITVNETIGLRPEMVAGVSPMRHPPGPGIRLDVVAGGAETPAWIGQSRDYADACRRHGAACAYHELAGEDHFSIMAGMETPEGPLARLVAAAAEARP
jgi:arylformamidase